MRIAIVHKEKCLPEKCANLCKNLCPVNRKGEKCIEIDDKASIFEESCIGCGICVNRCPFKAIDIINLPEVNKKNLIYRFGENGFCLYGIPLPRENTVLGLLGKNGIGKSTSLSLLSGKIKPNFGETNEASETEIKKHFAGNELFNYFNSAKSRTVSLKPQNLLDISKSSITVKEFLKKFTKESEFKQYSDFFNLHNILSRKLSQLSGGELQKLAILLASLKKADLYFYDEPLAYLDISERIRIAEFIKNKSLNKQIIVVEHDILVLDYITDFINILYGQPSCYGAVSEIKATRNAINEYLEGFLKEENVRFRDKKIEFRFGARNLIDSNIITEFPEFTKSYEKGGFKLKSAGGKIYSKAITAIAGKNATGKTTFIKCLAGLEETDMGKLSVDLKVSYKPQYLTGSEEIVMTIVKRDKINSRLVERLSLDNLFMKKLSELSGGELQRVAIASCLSKEADIFLLDEPSAYLDIEERLNVAKLVKEIINEKEKTCFVVDHDLLFLSYLADSIIVFSGEPGKEGVASKVHEFSAGLSELLKELNITIRKDKDSGRPRINKKDSVLDREQKEKGKYVEL
jgi:ATP-binding cassette subfamily E protein 1